MRACRSLRMILHGEDRKSSVAHPFQTLVVEVDMSDLHLARRKGVHIHAEPMILGSNLNFPVKQVLYGLVRSPVAEFQLIRFPPHGQPQELVAQADSENRFFPQKGPHGFDGIGQRRRVSGTV